MKFVFTQLALVAAFHVSTADAQQYASSVVGTDFDIIRDSDPSCFLKLKYQGIRSEEMPDKTDDAELFQKAHVFTASYMDQAEITIAVDADFETAAQAKQEALRYASRIGKLPTVLRAGVQRIVIHKGNEDATAFSDVGLIVMYSANATKRISTHDLEETLFHESVHAAWDKKHAKSAEWKRAQMSDGTFATLYGKKKPEREDLAESALFAFAMIHHPDRIPLRDRKKLSTVIPARIDFVNQLIPYGKPLIFNRNGESLFTQEDADRK
ncbi:MAG: hypothetical protein ABJZ55_12445 [Fuerstiella sp.]